MSCNLCGASDGKLFYEGEDARYADTPRVRFRLVRCRSCGLIYLKPRPTQDSLPSYYPDDFAPYRQDTKEQPVGGSGLVRLSHVLWNKIDRLKDAQRVRLIEQLHPEPGRVLDVGCATGRFLWQMQCRGWGVAGVEMNAAAAQQASQALRAHIQPGTLNSARFVDANFDVVTMFHVLEHLPDPLWALRRIDSLLRPGGFVVILVPNAKALEFSLLRGLDRNPVDIPRHLYHFSPTTLAELLRKAGLVPVLTKGFSWDAAPRVTRVLEYLVESWHPRSIAGRAIRSVYELTAFILGTGISAICGGLATAGPAFFLVGQKMRLSMSSEDRDLAHQKVVDRLLRKQVPLQRRRSL